MARELSRDGVPSDESRKGRPIVRPIAGGKDWSVSEFICASGPDDRPFEEVHDGYTIAAVVGGSFTYRGENGVALLHPGALLLGNNGKCFECGHDHGAGDRCISFSFSPELFCEIAAATAGTSRYKFSGPMLPARNHSIPILALVDAIARDPNPLHVEEVATRLVETVVSAFSDHVRSPVLPSKREASRIADAVRHIETYATEPLDLATLAALVNLSKYHFLRIFRRAIGMTPYQYLLAVRMRTAALRLAGSTDTVLSVALDSGFGDLSTFNGRFRSIFGVSPTAYRSAFAGRRGAWTPPGKASRKLERPN